MHCSIIYFFQPKEKGDVSCPAELLNLLEGYINDKFGGSGPKHNQGIYYCFLRGNTAGKLTGKKGGSI